MDKKEKEMMKENSMVMPAIGLDKLVAVFELYEQVKKQLKKDNDVLFVSNKEFLKKSYWRKLATAFNITTEIVHENYENIGATIVYNFTIKAIAPNGRQAIGTGSCDIYEKATFSSKDNKYYEFDKNANAWKLATPNSLHNTRATAETRATNRAISNLVGGGEVSAEEIINHETN